MTVKGQILKSASVIALVTLISRICGYLRDQRIALLLGTSPAADSFILVFQIPNLVRRMTGEGALGASFIPLFSDYLRNKSSRDALAFAQKMFWNIAAVLAVVAIAGFVFSGTVVHIFTVFGAGRTQWDLAVFLNRIVFPSVVFIGLAGLAMAILNSFHVFGLPASTTVFYNLAVIVSSFALVYRPVLRWVPTNYQTPAVALALGVVAGGILQLAVQVPALVRRGMKFAPTISFSDPGVRKVGRLMGPAIFGIGVYQINFFVDRVFATSPRMPSGSVTSLYLADRVMEFVLGSYAIAISTALLPTMSHQVAMGKHGEMKNVFGFSLRIASFITIPAAVGLILLRKPIIQVLFQHGQFSAASTLLTSHALLFYSLGLPAYAAIKLITPMYYSTQDTMTPARIGAYTLVMNVLLNAVFLVFFLRFLSNGSPALASSLAAYFNFVMLFVIFRKRFGRLGTRGLITSIAKMAGCAGAMAGAIFAGVRYFDFAAVDHLFQQTALLGGMILFSVGVYFGLAWLLRCEELSEFLLLLRRAEQPPVPWA